MPIKSPGWSRRELLAMTGGLAVLPAVAQERSPGVTAVMEQFRSAYQALDAEALEKLMTPDVVFVDPTFQLKARGLAELKAVMSEAARNLTAVTLTVEHELIAGSWAVVRQLQSVVLREPAGARITVAGVSLFRVEGGRIAEWHDYFDAEGFRRQLAAILGRKQ